MTYNDVRMNEIQLQAYEANAKKIISVYKELYDEDDIIIYDTKKKIISSNGTYIFKCATTPPDKRNVTRIIHRTNGN